MKQTLLIVAIIAAIAFPFVATAYEVARNDPFAGVVYGAIVLVFAVVLIAALRVGPPRSAQEIDPEEQQAAPEQRWVGPFALENPQASADSPPKGDERAE